MNNNSNIKKVHKLRSLLNLLPALLLSFAIAITAFSYSALGAGLKDAPDTSDIIINGMGSTSAPYKGYAKSTANTWYQKGTNILGGSDNNPNETYVDTFVLIKNIDITTKGNYSIVLLKTDTYMADMTVSVQWIKQGVALESESKPIGANGQKDANIVLSANELEVGAYDVKIGANFAKANMWIGGFKIQSESNEILRTVEVKDLVAEKDVYWQGAIGFGDNKIGKFGYHNGGVSSHTEMGFKVKHSGIYDLKVNNEVWGSNVAIKVSVNGADTTSNFQNSIINLPANQSKRSDTTIARIEIESNKEVAVRLDAYRGDNFYLKYLKLSYVSESSKYIDPDIALTDSISGNITSTMIQGTKDTIYSLPTPTSSSIASTDFFVSVTATDGTKIIQNKKWSAALNFIPTAVGTYIIEYTTPSTARYAKRTLALRVDGGYDKSNQHRLDTTTDLIDINNYTISPELGIGGATQQNCSGSLKFKVPNAIPEGLTSLEYNGEMTLSGLSLIKENAIEIYVNESSTPIVIAIASQDTPFSKKINLGKFKTGTNYITIKGITMNGNLILNDLSIVAKFVDTAMEDYTICEKTEIIGLLSDIDNEYTGNLIPTSDGLKGFNAFDTSYASYKFSTNVWDGSDYYVVITYSRTESVSTPAGIRLIANKGTAEESITRITLDSLSTQIATTASSQENAYTIKLNINSINTLDIEHAYGGNYYIKQVRISNDLSAPEFTLSSPSTTIDGFVGVGLELPTAEITDNFEAHMVCTAPAGITVTGMGTSDDPFILTANAVGKYVITLKAVDIATNESPTIELTVFIGQTNSPIITVDLSPLKVKSGQSFNVPYATASLGDVDLTDNILVSIISKDGKTTIFQSKPLSEARVTIYIEGEFVIKYDCTYNELKAFTKSIELTVIPTAQMNGTSATMSNGFANVNGSISLQNDSFMSNDAFTYKFNADTAGNYHFGYNIDVYSSSYSLIYKVNDGDYKIFTIAQPSSNIGYTAFDTATTSIKQGENIIEVIGATFDGNAWISYFAFKNDTATITLESATIFGSSDFSFRGDLTLGNNKIGRMNANANPTADMTVTASRNGIYNMEIVYTSSNAVTPKIALYINNAPFEFELSNSSGTINAKCYLTEGDNNISLKGLTSRGYTIKNIKFLATEDVVPSTLPILTATQPQSLEYKLGDRLTINPATLNSDIFNRDLMKMVITYNDIVVYMGRGDTSYTFNLFAYGSYKITYNYADSTRGFAATPLSYKVELADPNENGDNPNVTDPTSNKGIPGWGIGLIIAGIVLTLGSGGFLLYWFVIRKRLKIKKNDIK